MKSYFPTASMANRERCTEQEYSGQKPGDSPPAVKDSHSSLLHLCFPHKEPQGNDTSRVRILQKLYIKLKEI
uniref:Uncharacterized protein n=1 Tax=Anguilla anguilla TaxID=7936 RepID=A0A0E9SL99_ANGAN